MSTLTTINKNRYGFIIVPLSLIAFVAGILASLSIAWLTRSNELYRYVMILPLAFSVASFLTGNLYKNVHHSVVGFFVVGGYFARMVVQPFLFCLGGYVSFYTNVVNEENLLYAILLLSLENFVVFFVANQCSRHCVYRRDFKETIIHRRLYNEKLVRALFLLLVCFLFFAYYYVPELQTIFVLLPTADFSELAKIHWDNEMLVERGTGSRYIYSLFMFFWPIVRAVLPAFCIFQIYKKYGTTQKAVVLSMFCLLIPSFFLGGDNIAPFMGAMFGALVIQKLFKNKAKSAIIIIGIVFFALFTVVLISKILLFQSWRGAQGLASFSQILNAYLPGFDNIAVAYSIYNPDKISTLFFDIYYVIPFKETLFGFKGDNLTSLYTVVSSTGGQIIPWGYQLAHYFTMLGSVALTGFFVSIAYKSEIHSKLTENFFDYYTAMYLSVSIPISITIYSFSIFLRSYVNILLPVIIISYLCDTNKKIVFSLGR